MIIRGMTPDQIAPDRPLPELPPIPRSPRRNRMQLTPQRIATAAAHLRRHVTDEQTGWYVPVPGVLVTLAKHEEQLVFTITREDLPIHTDDLIIWQDCLGIPPGCEPEFATRTDRAPYTGAKVQKYIVRFTWLQPACVAC